jgi:hypothetical protein
MCTAISAKLLRSGANFTFGNRLRFHLYKMRDYYGGVDYYGGIANKFFLVSKHTQFSSGNFSHGSRIAIG